MKGVVLMIFHNTGDEAQPAYPYAVPRSVLAGVPVATVRQPVPVPVPVAVPVPVPVLGRAPRLRMSLSKQWI